MGVWVFLKTGGWVGLEKCLCLHTPAPCLKDGLGMFQGSADTPPRAGVVTPASKATKLKKSTSPVLHRGVGSSKESVCSGAAPPPPPPPSLKHVMVASSPESFDSETLDKLYSAEVEIGSTGT